MRSLLDNRKDLTPQQSMETLVKYARKQDSAVLGKRIRAARARTFFEYAFFTIAGTFVLYHFTAGYWTSFYPRNIISVGTEGVVSKKRQFFTPQLFLRDQEHWKAALKQNQLNFLKKSANQTTQH